MRANLGASRSSPTRDHGQVFAARLGTAPFQWSDEHLQRGQAVFETVIFLPMFLLTLFGIIWTVQAAVQYERVEAAVRYSGLVSQQANPYADYSLFSMYGQLGNSSLPTFSCTLALTSPLSDAAPTYYSNQITATASAPFWSPAAGAAQPYCAHRAGLIGMPAGTGLIQDVILSEQDPGMRSGVNVPGPLKSTLGTSLTLSQADEMFYRPIGENIILACYPTLNVQTTASLEYTTDTSAAVMPVPLTSVVPPIALSANASCTSSN